MTDSMKLHNPFLISIDTYYKTRIYSRDSSFPDAGIRRICYSSVNKKFTRN